MARMITSDIARCKSVVELSDVYIEWGGSFDHIHAAAALVKCGKLPGIDRSNFVDKLCSTWLAQLPLSGLQGCSNVLWACVRLGPGAVQRLWGPTWEAYIKQLRLESGVVGSCPPQNVANPLWACAKLRKQPLVEELQLIVQTFVQPAVLAAAKPQDLSNFVWALGELCRLPDWQGGVDEQEVQHMLTEQQLRGLAGGKSGQDPGNALLGLAHMACCYSPVITTEFARSRSQQLLAVADRLLLSSNPQHITNAMWACSQLGLADAPFVAAAMAAAPRWVPAGNLFNISQAAVAGATLKRSDEHFMRVLLLQLEALLLQRPHRGTRHAGHNPRTATVGNVNTAVAAFCYAIAQLNMQQLAEAATSLIARSGYGKQREAHVYDLQRLWVFHSWLLQHRLLDGKGLAGLLTQQQLQQGAKEASKYAKA
jgi:hypothetical protein